MTQLYIGTHMRHWTKVGKGRIIFGLGRCIALILTQSMPQRDQLRHRVTFYICMRPTNQLPISHGWTNRSTDPEIDRVRFCDIQHCWVIFWSHCIICCSFTVASGRVYTLTIMDIWMTMFVAATRISFVPTIRMAVSLLHNVWYLFHSENSGRNKWGTTTLAYARDKYI